MSYKLLEWGVLRKSDGFTIPPDNDNIDWAEYQAWLAEGNTPDPKFTTEEIAANAIAEEVRGLKADLQNAMVWQYRMITELWKALKANTTAQNSDIDPAVLAKAVQWTEKINRLKEIDE